MTRARRLLQRYDWPIVLAIAFLFGLAEGWIYSLPRSGEVLYWLVFFGIMTAFLVGWFAYAYGSVGRSAIQTLAFLPVAVTFQDATSLLAQGGSPATADWYVAFLPGQLHWLAGHPLVVPTWYVLAFALTSALDVLVDRYHKSVGE